MTVQEPVETPITEIELEVRDRNCFFVRLSAETDCLIRLEELIHRADGNLLQYFSIRDTSPKDIIELAASESAIAEARLVRRKSLPVRRLRTVCHCDARRHRSDHS